MNALKRILREYWFPLVLAGAAAAMLVVFVFLLPDANISWTDKGNIGQFVEGFFNGVTFIGFILSLWMQRREISKQQENLEKTRREMIHQTQFLQRQAEVQKEQLHQLKIQEVLANIRVLADNVAERADPATGVSHEVWKSRAITELSRANLMLLRKYSLEALQNLQQSQRTILKAFASDTIAAIKSNLRGAELKETNLEGVQLDNAFLVEADLEGANLRNAMFLGSNMLHANLGRANLDGADLGGAHLMNANLTRANLLGANLMEANLVGANLDEVILIGADLDHAQIDSRWKELIARCGAKNPDKITWTEPAK
ncbi:MAG: pentapeptide repeat-containing protein [SAR324 cluster bacterium]